MKYYSNIIALIVFYLFFTNQSILAQNEADSLLDYASKQVYENPEKAINIALKVYDRDDISTDVKVQSLLIIAKGYTSQRAYEKSLEYSLKAEQFASATNKKQQINVLNNIGYQYHQLKIYDKAIEYLDASFDIAITLPKTDSIAWILGYNYATRGFIYREQMNCDIALTYFDKAIEEFSNQVSNIPLNGNISIMLYNKGNCLISQNQYDEAEKSYLQSIEYAKKDEAKSLIAFAQKGLAEVMTAKGKNNEAITILKAAETYSNDVGDLVLNQGLYNALSENYFKINDFKNYKNYQEKYTQIQQEVKKNERNTIDQSVVSLISENEKKSKELNVFFNIIISVLYLLIICVVILLFYTIFSKEKKIKKLEKSLKI